MVNRTTLLQSARQRTYSPLKKKIAANIATMSQLIPTAVRMPESPRLCHQVRVISGGVF
jgi:hypothetical protein